MSQPATPAKPDRDLVHEVAGPFWTRRAVIGKIVSGLVLLPALLAQIQAVPDVHPPRWVTHAFLIAGAVGWWLSSLVSSNDAADSAARAALRGPGEESS